MIEFPASCDIHVTVIVTVLSTYCIQMQSLRVVSPVSVITTLPLGSIKTYLELRSLCTMPLAWRYPSACAICFAMWMHFSIGKGSNHWWIVLYSVCPLQKLETRNRRGRRKEREGGREREEMERERKRRTTINDDYLSYIVK